MSSHDAIMTSHYGQKRVKNITSMILKFYPKITLSVRFMFAVIETFCLSGEVKGDQSNTLLLRTNLISIFPELSFY